MIQNNNTYNEFAFENKVNFVRLPAVTYIALDFE